MKDVLPKVLQPVQGRELILYTLEAVSRVPDLDQIVVVVGYKKDEVIAAIRQKFDLPPYIRLDFVEQAEQKGTADAVRVALAHVRNPVLMVVCGDSPLITAGTLQKAKQAFFRQACHALVLTARLSDPASYGRIVRDTRGKFLRIKELKDLTAQEAKINEVNSGMYFLDRDKVRDVLGEIKSNPNKQEFFLTDLVELFNKKGYNVLSFALDDAEEMLSVNTLEELAAVDRLMKERQ
jgi:bifunctional UDP-N-acetylglucosamine pyrophosphorylase/glucosamine-1-phosphate N-acetyltransferase